MGLLDNALQALKSQYQETKGNVGLLMSDPKRYMSGLNQDAAEYNRLSSLALQAERNAYRGIPVSQEQAAAKQYIDQQQQDMALAFAAPIAYHGSPHGFSKFDINKVGTGEGAQAYGHGMYFAERPGVASEYQKNLSQEYANQVAKGGIRNPEYRKAQADLLRFDRELQKKYQFEGISPIQEVIQYGEAKFPKDVVERAKQLSGKEQEVYDRLKQGYLYKTDIPDEAAKTFLDWDKPLSQQNEGVRKSLNSLHPEVKNKILAKDVGGNEPTGNLIYNRLQEYFSGGKRNDAFANKASYGAKIASEELNSINIKGIQYKDALSRAKEEGTRNYVVFDPSIVQILERNNQPIQGLLK